MAMGRERGMIVCTLDAVMKARGVKGKDLARTVGMSEVNLSRVKRGKARMVKLATLEAICRELRCQPGDLMRYVPDEDSGETR